MEASTQDTIGLAGHHKTIRYTKMENTQNVCQRENESRQPTLFKIITLCTYDVLTNHILYKSSKGLTSTSMLTHEL